MSCMYIVSTCNYLFVSFSCLECRSNSLSGWFSAQSISGLPHLWPTLELCDHSLSEVDKQVSYRYMNVLNILLSVTNSYTMKFIYCETTAMRDHLSWQTTFWGPKGWSFKTGSTVVLVMYWNLDLWTSICLTTCTCTLVHGDKSRLF